MKRLLFFLLLLVYATAQGQDLVTAAKPLFRDPVHDGAADPVLIWNPAKKAWWMFYTNRRANLDDTTGVQWVHGTRIGIATSTDGGNTWQYVDTADIGYRPDSGYTFWAPDIIQQGGRYHMFLTYVPGIFSDWRHPRRMVHLQSRDLLHWQFSDTLQLASDRVIDASVFPLPGGGWRMWYNNERDKKSIYYADSKDLLHWEDKGKALGDRGGEGPKVFRWKDKFWMLVDNWAGMGIYSSTDLLHWNRQDERILEQGGSGPEDAAIGGHADVVVTGDRAFVFYFTHPGRRKDKPAPPNSYEAKRSLIQVAELRYEDGKITCDRNLPVQVSLPFQTKK